MIGGNVATINHQSDSELNVGVPGYGGGIMVHMRDGRIVQCGSVSVTGN